MSWQEAAERERVCRGGCGACKRAAEEHELERAVFVCSRCGEPVGWCQGGDCSPEDPFGDLCARCANERAAQLGH